MLNTFIGEQEENCRHIWTELQLSERVGCRSKVNLTLGRMVPWTAIICKYIWLLIDRRWRGNFPGSRPHFSVIFNLLRLPFPLFIPSSCVFARLWLLKCHRVLIFTGSPTTTTVINVQVVATVRRVLKFGMGREHIHKIMCMCGKAKRQATTRNDRVNQCSVKDHLCVQGFISAWWW